MLLESNEAPPPGWMTAAQWALRDGLSHGQMRSKLRQLVGLKRARTKMFRVVTSAGYMTPIAHYWVDAISPHVH